jgi:asparagine synthase (glutamine-hydrolysing)
MCGIGGVVGIRDEDFLVRFAASIADSLRHRGPDDEGVFVDRDRGVAMAHRRLSILDLSPAGHQPMATPNGRFTIVFNGEIYNFARLKESLVLQGVEFRGNSDTEVLLHLYARDGQSMVDSLEGMFAFAIWDRDTHTLFLARDPLGIKPLYIAQEQGRLAFASELRALVNGGVTSTEVDRSALAKYLLFGSVQEPGTLLKNVQMLPAGHTLTWHDGRAELVKYWEPCYGSERMDGATAVRDTRVALLESIKRHFISDVPVGIFLSGGMDSTALVALARDVGVTNIKTFSMSFDEQEFDEGSLAARTAAHFGTEHHDWRITSADGHKLFHEFMEHVDQPSNDGFNTFCVSRFAAQCGMKVVLSGLGGDELFGSYPSFRVLPQLSRWRRRIDGLGSFGHVIACGGLSIAERFTSHSRQQQAARLRVYLRSNGNPLAAYYTMRSFFLPTETQMLVGLLTGDNSPLDIGQMLSESIPSMPTPQDEVAYLETVRYMRNQLLRDSDVMSMANGLELRVPFVDRKLMESVTRIPASTRLAKGKKLLLDAVPEIPDWVAKAPKRGFSFPFSRWFENDWKSQFEDIEKLAPIKLGTWYRKWSLFTLMHSLRQLGVQITPLPLCQSFE